MRIELNKAVDVSLLTTEVSRALDEDVFLNVRQPGQKDGAGQSLPGLLVVLKADGSERYLSKADETLVRDVIADHVVPTPPEPPKPLMEQIAEAVSGATNFAELQAAILAFAQANAGFGAGGRSRSTRRLRG